MSEDSQKNVNKPTGSTGEVILQSPGEVTVKHDVLPPKSDDDKHIHPRRPLPLIPDKQDERENETPSEEP